MVNFMVNFNGITSKVPFHEFFEFTVEEISQVFEYMGLMSTKETCHVEPMEKYIFLHISARNRVVSRILRESSLIYLPGIIPIVQYLNLPIIQKAMAKLYNIP